MAIGSGEEDDVSIGTQSHSGRGVSSGGVVSIGGLVGEVTHWHFFLAKALVAR